MKKVFELSLDNTQKDIFSVQRIVFNHAQKAVIKEACGVAFDLWESRETGFEGEMPFLIGWAAVGTTTTCCPCGCGAPCGKLLLHLNTPEGIVRFTFIK